jgi:uncharacterized protein
MKTETYVLQGSTPGRTHQLTVLRFGQGLSGPKMYVQAGLHADEAPGMLVADVLRRRLAELEHAGQLRGEFVLVPSANPIGLGQHLMGQAVGRFELASGLNFNRNFPHLTDAALKRLDDDEVLGTDPVANQVAVRNALRSACEVEPQETEGQHLRKLLLSLALPCETVLDLHCDGESVVHLYTGTPLAPRCSPLAELLGAKALLTAEDSGDHPFDEALSRPWWEIQRAKPNSPIGPGCLSVTVELRGETDVSEELARTDAQAILAFAALQGCVELQGAEGSPQHALVKPTPLAGVEPLLAPISGVLAFTKEPGQWVAAGEEVARVVEPTSGQTSPIRASREGLLFARVAHRVTVAGRRVAKIAGREAFRSGVLLSP